MQGKAQQFHLVISIDQEGMRKAPEAQNPGAADGTTVLARFGLAVVQLKISLPQQVMLIYLGEPEGIDLQQDA